MKNFIIALLVALLLPLSPTLSVACSGVRFNFKWKEPIVNADGSAIIDLAKTTVYYSLGAAGSVVNKKSYVATKPTGGGWKMGNIVVAMNCKTQVNNISAWVTATNSMNNESEKSNIVIIPVPIISGGGL